METVTKLITGFVLLLVGIVLLTQISAQEQTKTQLVNVAGETIKITRLAGGNVTEGVTYTVASPPTTWRQADCPLTSFAIKNASGTALTVTTDYVPVLSAGTFTMKSTGANNDSSGFFNNANNLSYVSYTYCPDEYMNLSWGRTVLDIVPGLFAIALMLIGVGLFYSVYQEWK